MEKIIKLLKPHDLMILYVDNMWTVTIHTPMIKVIHPNLSAALLQICGKLLQKYDR